MAASLLFDALVSDGIGLCLGDLNWVKILFDRLGFVLNGRVCDVFSFMRYRYACEVIGFVL